MGVAIDGATQARLRKFLDETIGSVLGEKRRRASFAMYAMGLLGDGERKSMEPIAAKACGSAENVDSFHQRLGHFISDSNWSDRGVRRASAAYAIAAMTEHDPIHAWIVDDTGFLKQGKHSVGVQRQYTGSAGKITNCQIGVSLSIATKTEHLPIDFELYLPKSWAEDPQRRKEARIPDEVGFATKPELALKMVDHALKDRVPRGVLLADEGYGNSGTFRAGLRSRGLNYAVAINANTTVWVIDRRGGLGLVKWTAKEIATEIGKKQFRRTTWREGTNERLSARFATRRVVVGHDDGQEPKDREEQWLLMEWRDGDAEPAHFYLLTVAKDVSRKKMVRLVKERYRTERAYQDLKGELGLDHFEGRRYPGWHHHVSVALSCYAFITAEKVGAFSPSEGWPSPTRPHEGATGTTLRGLVHHHAVGDRANPELVAAAMSGLPPSQLTRSDLASGRPAGLTQ